RQAATEAVAVVEDWLATRSLINARFYRTIDNRPGELHHLRQVIATHPNTPQAEVARERPAERGAGEPPGGPGGSAAPRCAPRRSPRPSAGATPAGSPARRPGAPSASWSSRTGPSGSASRSR